MTSVRKNPALTASAIHKARRQRGLFNALVLAQWSSWQHAIGFLSTIGVSLR
jgi:hypothetical protein